MFMAAIPKTAISTAAIVIKIIIVINKAVK